VDLAITTLLDAPTGRAWEAVRTPALLEHVAAPLVAFEPVDPPSFPERWVGRDYLVALTLFGVLPLGTQTIRITIPGADDRPGAQLYRIRDDGTGRIAATWDHLITLRETPDGKTAYTDEVTVDAGVLTPLVWLFAAVFYRYRQHRWRRLVANGFAY
jgi:hypothetical protein